MCSYLRTPTLAARVQLPLGWNICLLLVDSLISIFVPGVMEGNEDMWLGGLNLMEPEVHDFEMRIKHLLTLKQNLKPPPRKNLATSWLTIDIHNYSKDFQLLMDNGRTKTLNNKKLVYYQDITRHIKTATKRSQNKS